VLKPLVRPFRVRPGDTVAVVSPSFGAIGMFPHRVERARDYLGSIGLKVRLMPNAAHTDGWASAPAEARAEDIHLAFLDEEVAVVLAGIGGNHSNQLLPFLDWELIRSHPKVFQGYSDITVLHWAFLKHSGLSTFYGPALVPELGEYPHVLLYTDRFLRAAWFGSEPIAFESAEEWTDERLDWRERQDLTRPRELRASDGWIALREGIAEGTVLGGCLETVCWHLKGSATWIDPAGAILFLETSEEAPSPAHVDAYLTDLEQLGVFEAAAALVFGRPYGYDEERETALWQVVAERTDAAGIPVLANVELGHTDPMLTVPLGVAARLDPGAKRFELLEPPTAERH
jgi:muramoyltetrapeptide carboxypeptidase LdcA involved in peptidoglycan recycling